MQRMLRSCLLLGALLCAGCPPGPRCDPKSCSGCCLGGVCATGDEDTACGRGGFSCFDCSASQRTCQTGACVGDPLLEGRDCAHPISLALTSSQSSVQGDTRGGGEGAEASCGGAGAPERVYLLQTIDTATMQVEVRPLDGRLKPVVSVRPVCGAPDEAAPGCVAAAAAGEGAALTVRSSGPGSWYLTVDGADGTAGPFTLSVTRQFEGGESCTAPLPLNFPAAGATTLKGSLAGAAADVQALCGGSGPDLVYRFATGRAHNVVVALATFDPAMRPVVYVRGLCAQGELACAQAAENGGTASAQALEVPAGSHHLVVDSATPQGGVFELRAELAQPPLGASCLNPRVLDFSGQSEVAFDDDTAPLDGGFARGAQGSCGGLASGERVYRFTTSALANLTATATPLAGGQQTPLLYLRRSGCAGNEVLCRAASGPGATGTLAAGNLPADTWFLFVDGATAVNGPFRLTVRLDPPLPGDACGTAQPLAFADAGTAFFASTQDTTQGLFDDVRPSCDGTASPDRVYTFTTASLLSLRATVAPLDAGYQPVVLLRQGSCLSASERACAKAAAAGATADLSAGSLPAGTWQLWVDGAGGGAGPFSLSAQLTTPPPGEACAGAEPLFLDGGTDEAVGGTLLGYASDSTASCGGAAQPDRVWRFSTTETMNLRARLSPQGPEEAVLYLRSYGCLGGERACARGTAVSGGALLEVAALPQADHWLWVDSSSPDAGAFTLTATLSPPPVGDACPAPRFLALSDGTDGGSAQVAGDTTALFGNTAACSGTGPDEVWSFSIAAPRVLTAAVTPLSSGFRPAVSVRSFCTSSTSAACGLSPAAGAPANISVSTLPAGTWYLWVDGVGATRGAYTLQVDLD